MFPVCQLLSATLMANGPAGWIQAADFLLTGVLVIAASDRHLARADAKSGRDHAPRPRRR